MKQHTAWIAAALILSLTSGCASYTRSMIWENKIKPHSIEKTALSVAEKPSRDIEVEYLWLGHATVLIRLHDHWLMTDPVLHKRIGPPELFNNAFGIKRRKELPLAIKDLPDLTAVLISHAHYDHLDLPSLRSVYSKGAPALIVPRKVSDLTAKLGGKTTELDWISGSKQSVEIDDLAISAFRVEHYGYIPWGKRNQWTGFNGYVIQSQDKQILFFGDTSYHRYRNAHGQLLKKPERLEWRKKFSKTQLDAGFDLCIIPIGDSHFRHNHTTPEEAVDIALELGCKKMLPIHYETFVLSPPEPEGEDARSRMVRYLQESNQSSLIQCSGAKNPYPEIGNRCRLD